MKLRLIGSMFFSLCIVNFTSFCVAIQPQDWLKEAYRESHYSQTNPFSSNLEADEVFQQAIGNAGSGDNVVVRFSRFLMRMAVVIAVSMLIFTGIKIGLAMGDSGKFKTALKDAGIVLVGIFIALASVAIVYLVSSLMRGSIDYSLFKG